MMLIQINLHLIMCISGHICAIWLLFRASKCSTCLHLDMYREEKLKQRILKNKSKILVHSCFSS